MNPIGDRLSDNVPEFDATDPASLEAFHGAFGHWDIWRKTVLSNCREIVRAVMTQTGEKITEARLDDLARTHPNYLSFLTEGLQGRALRESNVREQMGLR